MAKETVIVSACLLGVKSRYDGTDAFDGAAVKAAGAAPVPVCPEQLGGLRTPRPRCEVHSGDGLSVLEGTGSVKDEGGVDVTELFLNGAVEALKIARITGAKRAVLKEGSPSCGVDRISRNGRPVRGSGVTAALFRREGIEIKGF
ncbi:MAG: DUF523 domain-containing protein [Thermodesulfobacteriota bacterium]